MHTGNISRTHRIRLYNMTSVSESVFYWSQKYWPSLEIGRVYLSTCPGDSDCLLIFEESVHSSSGVIGGMTAVTAVMKEDASMNRVNSTSLLVRTGAAFPKPTSVMGIMTVVMNLMSWNISVVHQKRPALPIILNVTMETALSWLKSAIGWMIA